MESSQAIQRPVAPGIGLILGLLLVCMFALPLHAQQPQTIFPAQIPERILAAKTVALVVSWPEGSWQERLEIQGDGQDFLRKWKRYKVVEDSMIQEQFHGIPGINVPRPELVAVVVVKPLAWRASTGRSFLAGLFAGMQAFGAAQPIQTYCSGTETAIGDGQHASLSADCTSYVPPASASSPVQPVWPSYVYGGSIVIFDGPEFDTYASRIALTSAAPIATPEPLLVALADDHGSEPLLRAAKRLRKAIDTAEKTRKRGDTAASKGKPPAAPPADAPPADDLAQYEVKPPAQAAPLAGQGRLATMDQLPKQAETQRAVASSSVQKSSPDAAHSLLIGPVRVWLGMPMSELQSKLSDSQVLKATETVWLIGYDRNHTEGMVWFTDGVLTVASREWRAAGSDDIQALLGAIDSLTQEGLIACSIWHDTAPSPSSSMERATIDCGAKRLIISKGKTGPSPQSGFEEINEVIGFPESK